MSKQKKTIQLGMNPSTASGRLIKDTLWRLIVETKQDNCFQCGDLMTRENFSVEHKEPWLDSEDPVGLFFDQCNISFSHHLCNIKAGRKGKGYTPDEALNARRESNKKSWSSEKRREYYLRSGK